MLRFPRLIWSSSAEESNVQQQASARQELTASIAIAPTSGRFILTAQNSPLSIVLQRLAQSLHPSPMRFGDLLDRKPISRSAVHSDTSGKWSGDCARWCSSDAPRPV